MGRACFLALLVLSLAPAGAAQDGGFGLGVLFGEPTGVSAKHWVSRQNAVDGGLSWSFGKGGFFHVHADYLWHFPDAFRSPERFPLYVGVGGRIRFGTPAEVGVRIPLGIAWWPADAPLDVFLEIAPVLDLAPKTEFDGNGGIGIRYFFR